MASGMRFCSLRIYSYLAIGNNNINHKNLYAYRNISALELT